jgi:2,3-bisphosphoglycerate-independent phosphoglycerate mutase
MRSPLILLVLDGWGLSPERKHNAIALARTPSYDELTARFPTTELTASGERVGLPDGQMGNSEVGHTNMGAGRVVYQDLTRIDKSIEEGDFFTNEVLTRACDAARGDRHALHLMGLVSDGGVHSHLRHAKALVELAHRRGVKRLFVHAFTDGRDTSPASGVSFVHELRSFMDRLGLGQIASVSGRYFAMDRDKRWDRTTLAFDAVVRGEGPVASDPGELLSQSYGAGTTDEFIAPTVMVSSSGAPVGPIRDGDSVVCFNFRADRVRQLTAALTQSGFDGFARAGRPSVEYACLTEYDPRFGLPVAFTPQEFVAHLGEVLGASGLSNLRLAETEKYAHVTYFFNCGHEEPYPGEDRLLIPSPKVATYDKMPEMSARGIADALLDDIRGRRHDVIICNFANADMVGHTGSVEATVSAVEVLDECLGRIARAAAETNATLLVTADHGNCEQMWDAERDMPHTAHTANPVPFIVVTERGGPPLRGGGALCDVAPTILQLIGLKQPTEMTGESLFTP